MELAYILIGTIVFFLLMFWMLVENKLKSKTIDEPDLFVTFLFFILISMVWPLIIFGLITCAIIYVCYKALDKLADITANAIKKFAKDID